MKNKKIVIFSIFALILVSAIVGITYSYISGEVEMEKSNIIVSGVLKLDLEEDKPISLLTTYPMTETAGLSTTGFKFKLKNTGNLPAAYEIYLDDIEVSNQISSNYLRFSLLKDGNFTTGTNSVQLSTMLPTSPNRVIDSGTISKDAIYSYELRMWVDEKAPNSVQTQEYKARIRIESIQSEGVE